MHVLFLAPDLDMYGGSFVEGLVSVGAKVSGIGLTPPDRLAPALRRHLDGYVYVERILDYEMLLHAAERLAGGDGFDRIETIEEQLVEHAGFLRDRTGVPGLSETTAILCRDKTAMKEHLRRHGIACAQSASVSSEHEAFAFAEHAGFPLILKPVAGFGSLSTYRVTSTDELRRALGLLHTTGAQRIAMEEFVEGHEGFYDAIIDDAGIRHDFVSHYYPGCLEATVNRWISPQIVVTNRLDLDSYREVRDVGRRVVEALGLERTATHMEWFFGPKGLKVSEIGARPAGERIWDMYNVANDFSVYREWALAIVGEASEQRPSRRLAAGHIQIRPDRDGTVAGYAGLDDVWQRCGQMIYESQIPTPGSPTRPLDKGYLVNTWFRLRHPDYDELRRSLDFIGDTVRMHATA